MVWEFVCPKGWEVIQRWGAPNYRTDGCHRLGAFERHHTTAQHHPLGCDVQQLVR